MNEELGIVSDGQLRRAKYARFQYRAPFIRAPKKVIRPEDRPGAFAHFRMQHDKLIVRAVTIAWGIDENDILTGSMERARKYAYPRFACFKLMRDRMNYSFPVIGRIFSRDHSTIKHGFDKANGLYELRGEWRKAFDDAVAELDS